MKKIVKKNKDGVDSIVLEIPEKEDILNLKVGDMVLNCFGHARVQQILYRDFDSTGKYYVGFRTDFGPFSGLSGSIKEGRVIRTLKATTAFDSAES